MADWKKKFEDFGDNATAAVYRSLPEFIKKAPRGGDWDELTTSSAKTLDTAMLGLPSALFPSIRGYLQDNAKYNPSADFVGGLTGALIPTGTAAAGAAGGGKVAKVAGDIIAGGISGFNAEDGDFMDRLGRAGQSAAMATGGNAVGKGLAELANAAKSAVVNAAARKGEQYAVYRKGELAAAAARKAHDLLGVAAEEGKNVRGAADAGVGNRASRATHANKSPSAQVGHDYTKNKRVMRAYDEAKEATDKLLNFDKAKEAEWEADFLLGQPAYERPMLAFEGVNRHAPQAFPYLMSTLVKTDDSMERSKTTPLKP